jgi:hypothetical protein
VTTQDTITVEIRDNAHGTAPVFGWGWPDEVALTDFAEQDARAEKNDRAEQTEQPVKDDSAYAALYFMS